MALDFVAWHGRDLSNHNAETTKAAAQLYRTLSLCIYGEPNNPLYAAVMIKRPAVHAEQQLACMTQQQFSQTIDLMWQQKMGAYLVSATGPVNNPRFAASFRPMNQKPIVKFGILNAANQLWELNREHWQSGYRVVWMDAYGTPDNMQFVAVWHPNPQRIGWNIEAASWPQDTATTQSVFNAITAQGGRPVMMAITPGENYLGIYHDNQAGGWASRGNLTGDGYQQLFTKQVALGRCPISVMAQGTGDAVRYTAIFADGELPVAQQPTATTTIKTSPPVKGIDEAMFKFMHDHAMRGCSLAITKGTRLVYARGYTLAEPGYPALKETTLFRQASVSKVFAAAAIHRLIQLGVKNPDGSLFGLNTTLQTVLNLTIPPLKVPDNLENKMDVRFKDITIGHLLESVSSINQGYLWWHQAAAESYGKTVPGSPEQLASYIAGKALGTKNPGDTTNVQYGNVDYFLLSQVAAKLAGTKTFEEALTKLVLTPLQCTRVRGSRSLQANQATDEARYHLVNIRPAPTGKPNAFNDGWRSLQIDWSNLMAPSQLLPTAYGAENYEIYDGCGGLSASVVDIARLVAAFSVRSETAVFKPATLKTWFDRAWLAHSTYTNDDPDVPLHGYHGLDWGVVFDTNKASTELGNFAGAKGGWLPSHGSTLEFTTGGYGYVIACNSVGQSDVKTDCLRNLDGKDEPGNEVWKADPGSVVAVTEAHDWGTIDLFPAYGMISFTAPKVAFPIPLPKLPKNVVLKGGVPGLEQRSMSKSVEQAPRPVFKRGR